MIGDRSIYLIGGSVRDYLLRRQIKDYDFVVGGSGFDFARKFAKKVKGTLIPLSKAEDEIRVHFDKMDFDFRGLDSGIDDDLKRRDFTINAISYDLKEQKIYDPFGGKEDLDNRVLRPISENSLMLDPLRLLRGFRFVVDIGLKIDTKFLEYAKDISLDTIAKERIWMELARILKYPSFRIICTLDDLGILVQIIPELKPLKDSQFWKHSLDTLKFVDQAVQNPILKDLQPEYDEYLQEDYRVPILKLSGLMHDLAKPYTRIKKDGEVHFYGHDSLGSKFVKQIGKERLKLSNVENDMLAKLVREHMRPHLLTGCELTNRAIRRFLRDLGDDFIGSMILAWADGKATAGKTRHLKKLYKKIINFYRMEKEQKAFQRLINGYDLIEMGLEPGPIFKKILTEVEEHQKDGNIRTKKEALAFARRLIEEIGG